MATWVTHLRVSQRVLKNISHTEIDETAYYVGSIAPDSGKMVDDFTYLPPKDVSHWKRENVSYEQRFEDNAQFYLTYGEKENDVKRRSFFLGYYVHILTDTIFVRDVIHPYMNGKGHDHWKANITEIRGGWYEIDFRFMDKHHDFYPLQLLKNVDEFPNTYLDYFDYDDITERVKNCIELYSSCQVHPNQRFLTISEEGMIKLMDLMAETITKILKEKHNIY